MNSRLPRPLDPRIGILCREGNTVYYKNEGGYVEGSLDEVKRALGLEPAAAKKPRKMSTYVVTVTPRHKAYCGTWEAKEYTVDKVAYDRNSAIAQARSEWNENNMGNPATYTARRKQED